MNPMLRKNHEAGGAVAPHRIVKFGAADGVAVQAAGATDQSIGVSANLIAAAAGDRLDVHLAGLVEVEYGGAVTRGALLTADADGKAVVAAPTAAGAARVVGVAHAAGAAGDIGLVHLAPSVLRAAA